MYLLLINLYEFGQFLRILLWISVPMVVVSMLVTTWLHYRRKRQLPEELLLSLPGMDGVNGIASASILQSAGELSGHGQEPLAHSGANDELTLGPEEKENIYKGILWMKEKYEQYRDMADRRHEELKEQLAKAEKKYQDLVESGGSGVQPAAAEAGGDEALSDLEKASYPALLEEKNRQITYLQQQLDQRIKSYYQSELEGRENKSRMLEVEEGMLRTRHILEEKQAYIDQLEGQLVSERRKIEELVIKLQASSQQLLAIYEELDRSMKAPDPGEATGAVDGLLNSPSEP